MRPETAGLDPSTLRARHRLTWPPVEIDPTVTLRVPANTAFVVLIRAADGVFNAQRLAGAAAGKSAEGQIEITLAQELNDVSVVFADDGAGLDLVRLREKAAAQGLIEAGAEISDAHAAQQHLGRGVEAGRITTLGAGKRSPVASNENAAGRQQNRRVEVIISNPALASS